MHPLIDEISNDNELCDVVSSFTFKESFWEVVDAVSVAGSPCFLFIQLSILMPIAKPIAPRAGAPTAATIAATSGNCEVKVTAAIIGISIPRHVHIILNVGASGRSPYKR